MGGTSDSPARRIALILGVTALVLALVPVAFAGKGRGGKGGGGTTTGTGSLTLVMVTDKNANHLPNWGDTVRFNVSTTATTEPHVNLTCAQNGVVVYGASTGYYASYPWPWTQNMTLSSTKWTGGSATCKAVLQSYSGTSVTTLGTLSFTVGA